MRKVVPLKNRKAVIAAPSAKAYTLRTLVLASLAEGTSHIKNPLLGEDQLNLISCLRSLGTGIIQEGNDLIVTGCGGLYHPNGRELNAGESGVTMNFLSSLTALCDKEIILTGKEGLLKRPVEEVIKGVRQLGGRVEYLKKEGFPPVRVIPSPLKGGRAVMSGSKTSQYFSSLVIAGALTEGETTLVCSDSMSERPYFDITTEMMEKFGVKVINHNYQEMVIPAGQKYRAVDMAVEGDFSSAAFLFQAAALCGTEVTVTGLEEKSAQGDRAFLPLLEKMGCTVCWQGQDVTVTGGHLNAIEADMTDIPDLAPSLAVTAAFAWGNTILRGVSRLRYKECDRLEAIKVNLEALGGKVSYDEDNLFITGMSDGKKVNLKGGVINPFNDHRIAMAFGMAGLAIEGVSVKDPGCVAKSFPDFWERLASFYNSDI
jgi:3-phosphoshikimate 1-carboxyvinyltransferase